MRSARPQPTGRACAGRTPRGTRVPALRRAPIGPRSHAPESPRCCATNCLRRVVDGAGAGRGIGDERARDHVETVFEARDGELVGLREVEETSLTSQPGQRDARFQSASVRLRSSAARSACCAPSATRTSSSGQSMPRAYDRVAGARPTAELERWDVRSMSSRPRITARCSGVVPPQMPSMPGRAQRVGQTLGLHRARVTDPSGAFDIAAVGRRTTTQSDVSGRRRECSSFRA